jgi:hypothetical protein
MIPCEQLLLDTLTQSVSICTKKKGEGTNSLALDMKNVRENHGRETKLLLIV